MEKNQLLNHISAIGYSIKYLFVKRNNDIVIYSRVEKC